MPTPDRRQARLAGLDGVLDLRDRDVELGQGAGRWQRMYQDAPMTLDTGTPITAANVIIQQVVVTESDLVDVLGYHSPEVTLTGSGKAWSSATA